VYGAHILKKEAVLRSLIHEQLQLAELMFWGWFVCRWVECQALKKLFCPYLRIEFQSIFQTDRDKTNRKHKNFIFRKLCL